VAKRTGGSISRYITRAGLKRWRYQWFEGGKRLSRSFPTKKEAELFRAQTLVDTSNRGAGSTHEPTSTFQEYSNEWLDSLSIEASTRQGYKKILRNHLLPEFGPLKLEDITPQHISKHYERLATTGRKDSKGQGLGLGSNSIGKVHLVLKAILTLALDEGLIFTNPAKNKRVVKAPTSKQIRAQLKEIETLSVQELEAFLEFNQAEEDDLNPMYRLIAYTGIRRGEAVAIQWSDINFAKKTLSIRRAGDTANLGSVKSTKTNRARNLELTDSLIQDLEKHRANRELLGAEFVAKDAFVFGSVNNTLRRNNDVGARFSRAVDRARKGVKHITLPHFTLKTLRHSHATQLLAEGVNPKIVQERLGHSDITVTMNTYSHVTPTMQREAIEKLENTRKAVNE